MILDSRRARVCCFVLFLAFTATVFRAPLIALAKLSLSDERYNYVCVIPVITFGLILLNRKIVFSATNYCPAVGIPLMLAGIALAYRGTISSDLTLAVCGIVLICAAGFILIFGLHALRAAGFPVGFLFLMIPVPIAALNHVVAFLQHSSAYISGLIFRALTIPALRQGLIISLPGINIEIAEQCSGIRSSVSLVLASSVAAYIFLQGDLNRLFLILITVPVVILKNAIRIVSLASLALYVNKGFLFGRLHHYGGLCFSVLDLAIVIPLILQLHKSEARRRGLVRT